MDNFYGLKSTADYSDNALMSPDDLILPVEYQSFLSSGAFRDRIPIFGSGDLLPTAPVISKAEVASTTPEILPEEDMVSVIKAKISSHPRYPRLLEAYIDCQKVGASPEMSSLLEEILLEKDLYKRGAVSTCYGSDPELDEFMETYCDMLVKYKSDLARPFDEATTFLNKIETQLSNLSTAASKRRPSGVGDAVSSEDEYSGGETDVQEAQTKKENKDLKDMLSRRFGSHIGTLKLEFSKKKQNGKLPKEARQMLLEWWNVHYRWPYPTEADKIALVESTGLDQKQINNWFINQRKRHWKASENMQFAMMDNHPRGFFTE